MSPADLAALGGFLLGLAAGVLLREAIVQVERRAAQRRRLQKPPFTTVGQGSCG